MECCLSKPDQRTQIFNFIGGKISIDMLGDLETTTSRVIARKLMIRFRYSHYLKMTILWSSQYSNWIPSAISQYISALVYYLGPAKWLNGQRPPNSSGLCLTFRIHVKEGKTNSTKLPSDFHTSTITHTPTHIIHTHTHTNNRNKICYTVCLHFSELQVYCMSTISELRIKQIF